MKIKQVFKDSKKPKDINPAELDNYFRELYQDDSFDSQANSYAPTGDTKEKREKQVQILVNKLTELSYSNKFEALKDQLLGSVEEQYISTFDAMRKTAEAICFKLANNQVQSREKFDAEVKSFTINACTPGAVTNLQKALYAMDNSLYPQKYDYIQNLANAYVIDNKIDKKVYEVHRTNELIHEVSKDYNVIPPNDMYAVYRDLSIDASGRLVKNVAFKDYLDQHFASREGIHGFIDHVSSNSLAKLPFPTNFAGAGAEANERRDAISEAANECGLTMHDITETSEDYTETKYKPEYLSILKAGMIRKMAQENILEPNFLKIDGKEIIESPDSWVKYDPKTNEYEELFSTKELKGLTIGGKNIEDYLHNKVKKTSQLPTRDTVKQIMLQSDQVPKQMSILSKEDMDSISTKDMKKWFEFIKVVDNEEKALNYISNFGNKQMFNKYLQVTGKTYESFIGFVNSDGKPMFHIVADLGCLDVVEYFVKKKSDLNALDQKGKTPLYYLITSPESDEKRLQLIYDMIKGGADLTTKDISAAIKLGHIELMEKLMEAANERVPIPPEFKGYILDSAKTRSKEYVERIKAKFEVLEKVNEHAVQVGTDSHVLPSQKNTEEKKIEVSTLPIVQPITTGVVSLERQDSKDNDHEEKRSSEVDLEQKKQEYAALLDKKYNFRNVKVKEKVKKYIQSTELKESAVFSKDYAHYAEGNARKGVASKFAELLKGFRSTDNEMIKKITQDFNQYAASDSKPLAPDGLPKRYNKSTVKSQSPQ